MKLNLGILVLIPFIFGCEKSKEQKARETISAYFTEDDTDSSIVILGYGSLNRTNKPISIDSTYNSLVNRIDMSTILIEYERESRADSADVRDLLRSRAELSDSLIKYGEQYKEEPIGYGMEVSLKVQEKPVPEKALFYPDEDLKFIKLEKLPRIIREPKRF